MANIKVEAINVETKDKYMLYSVCDILVELSSTVCYD